VTIHTPGADLLSLLSYIWTSPNRCLEMEITPASIDLRTSATYSNRAFAAVGRAEGPVFAVPGRRRPPVTIFNLRPRLRRYFANLPLQRVQVTEAGRGDARARVCAAPTARVRSATRASGSPRTIFDSIFAGRPAADGTTSRRRRPGRA